MAWDALGLSSRWDSCNAPTGVARVSFPFLLVDFCHLHHFHHRYHPPISFHRIHWHNCAEIDKAGERHITPKAKCVDYITYGDLLELFDDSGTKTTLAANPALRLAMRKHNETVDYKTMIQADIEWYNNETKRFTPMKPS